MLLFRSLQPALAQDIPELGDDVTFATRDRQGGVEFEVILYKFVPALILTGKIYWTTAIMPRQRLSEDCNEV